jgi:hypothetical protein
MAHCIVSRRIRQSSPLGGMAEPTSLPHQHTHAQVGGRLSADEALLCSIALIMSISPSTTCAFHSPSSLQPEASHALGGFKRHWMVKKDTSLPIHPLFSLAIRRPHILTPLILHHSFRITRPASQATAAAWPRGPVSPSRTWSLSSSTPPASTGQAASSLRDHAGRAAS